MAEVYKRLKKGCKWCQWSLLWVKHILKWNKVKNTKHLSDLQVTPHTNMKCRRIPLHSSPSSRSECFKPSFPPKIKKYSAPDLHDDDLRPLFPLQREGVPAPLHEIASGGGGRGNDPVPEIVTGSDEGAAHDPLTEGVRGEKTLLRAAVFSFQGIWRLTWKNVKQYIEKVWSCYQVDVQTNNN